MRYVPYGSELEQTPNIVVDGRGNDATVLELSHWPRNRTPAELKADTSTEIALNYARSAGRETYRRGSEAVSNNHYDVDGLMSMWTVLNPATALEHTDLLVATGECGDFDRWSGEHATKIACALYGMELGKTSPVRQTLAGMRDYLARTEFLYRHTLPLVPELISNVDSFEEYWRDEFARVQADLELFATGEASLQEVSELDLAVFDLPRRLHDMALYEQTDCSRVALVIEGHRYQVRYRYESWVEFKSRAVPPRIDLKPLADLLQTFEGNDGDWTADETHRTLPHMRLRGPEGSISPSSITPGLFLRLLVTYLRDNADNAALLWSPNEVDVDYVEQLASD
jgi:hypothetical protein